VEFRILGTLEVESEGTRLDLGPPKQQAVLAVLLLHANLATERGRAADAQRMEAYADWWLGTNR
jgi:DNA-binding SARP family transcriptional activator